MNPNSAHQRWSKWIFTITPGGTQRPLFAQVKEHCARFGRKAFGSASSMRITDVHVPGPVRSQRLVKIEVLTEGHPVHDPAYVEFMRASWTRFAENGWGRGTTLALEARLMAGTRQDGTPADQLIIAPSLALTEGV